VSKEKIVVGIDIGSAKICTIIASVSKEGQITVIGVSTVPSAGIKKGVVVDIDDSVDSISMSLEGAERMSGYAVSSAFISVGGNHIASLNSHGVVAISNPTGEITEEDVARVTEAARAISIPSSREIIHVLPKSFIVDSQEGVHDPVGMSGVRLEVETHIISGASTSMRNLVKCVQQAGVDVEDLVFSALASSYATLSDTEKELGVILVDMGAGTTDVAIFIEGAIAYSSVLPIGGRNITNDLAIGLRTSLEDAEKIKLHLSSKETGRPKFKETNPTESKSDVKEEKRESKEDEIDVSDLNLGELKTISKKFLIYEIIKPRLKEIMTLVALEIKKSGFTNSLPAGIVLTGGASETVGIKEISKEALNLPVRIAKPEGVSGLIDEIQSPAYSTSVGLIIFGSEVNKSKVLPAVGITQMKGLVGKVISWIKSLIP